MASQGSVCPYCLPSAIVYANVRILEPKEDNVRLCDEATRTEQLEL
jgi:hypothetical protein